VRLRRALITALILSFALAIYSIWFQPLWNSYLESQGRQIGVAETAMGYFITIMITYAVNYFVTRKLEVE